MDVKDEWKVAWHDSKQDGVRCQCVAKETKKRYNKLELDWLYAWLEQISLHTIKYIGKDDATWIETKTRLTLGIKERIDNLVGYVLSYYVSLRS